MKKTISWFSSGVSSAVATKLAIDKIDGIIYIHIEDHHPDTLRFKSDCERWFGHKIETIQSNLGSVKNAILLAGGRGYINGPSGAACSFRLKRELRKQWELEQTEQLRYVWGMDYTERRRADRVRESMPDQEHLFPLIDQNIDKEEAHRILRASDIKRPAMYELGYNNNNCVGCVKGGMGYWNKIRKDFPEVFKARAELERKVRASCINGTFLDELDPEAGRELKPIVGDCGIFCEIMGLDNKEVEE